MPHNIMKGILTTFRATGLHKVMNFQLLELKTMEILEDDAVRFVYR
jgi:hypothetical protein